MFGVQLKWSRYPDGVEVVDLGGPSIPLDAMEIENPLKTKGKWFCAKTATREVYQLTLADLEDTLLIKFINARTDNQRCSFIARYGIPGFREDDHFLIQYGRVIGFQSRLLELLESTDIDAFNNNWHPTGNTYKAYLVRGERGPEFVFRAAGLDNYMCTEAAFSITNGAELFRCNHCDDAFLTGPLTWRRSHAKYCSDRCRVAAMRLRNKSQEKA
ncbi:hypothetical protein [Pseudorhodoplanes sp.]|uniref:hypothetical protein n=1 Tax=Pseudorhodoplanes sp. TaxID=1934341 RepID=UPI003D0A56CB